MTVAQQTSGTQSATVTTEHILAETGGGNDLPVGKTYVLNVDCNAMVAGDILELRVYTKVLTGSTARVAYLVTYAQALGEPNVLSIPIPTAWYTKFTLKQTAGTSRSFDWSVFSL